MTSRGGQDECGQVSCYRPPGDGRMGHRTVQVGQPSEAGLVDQLLPASLAADPINKGM